MKKSFVKTENYARFTAGVKAVEQRGAAEAGMMLVHGQPGFGKSHIVSRWAEDAGAIFLRANVDMTPKYFLTELCRALNIPARLVVGYVWFDEPPQDFHAIFEAWLGGRWVLFDATGMAPPEKLVRTGTGRDAKDVAFSTLYGAVQMTRKELRVDEGDRDVQLRIEAELSAEDA